MVRSKPNEAVIINAIPITTLIFLAALEVPDSTINMAHPPTGLKYGANVTVETT